MSIAQPPILVIVKNINVVSMLLHPAEEQEYTLIIAYILLGISFIQTYQPLVVTVVAL